MPWSSTHATEYGAAPDSTARIADSSSINAVNICSHNETLSVVAMRVSNPDCSPVAIHG
jgi:hypothetical protein